MHSFDNVRYVTLRVITAYSLIILYYLFFLLFFLEFFFNFV